MKSAGETLQPAAADPITAGTTRYWQANLALFCAGFITFATLYDIQPLLPLFSMEFGVSPAAGSLPLSVSTCALALSMLVAGTISETTGRKPLIATSLMLTSLLAILTAFNQGYTDLLLLRVVQGIFLAGVPSVAMAYLGDEMSPSAIGSAVGLYISGNVVGGMCGRLASAIMSDHLPWRLVIGLIGCFSLVLALIFLLTLPTACNFTRRRFQTGYLLTSLCHHLRDPVMLLLFSVAFLAMGSFITLYNYITFRLIAPPYSLSQSTVSLIFLVYSFGSLSASCMGKLLLRFGRRFMVRLTLGTMLLGITVTLAGKLSFMVSGVALFTCGFFGIHTIAAGWVGKRAVTAKAQASSLYLFSYYLGSSISGTIGGYFWAGHGWNGVSLLIASLLLLAVGATEFLDRKESAFPPLVSQ